jgi:cytochrome c oxidase assembly protein subunit 11
MSNTRKAAIIAASVAAFMLGAAYASVPLYKLFCQATGFDGTTKRAKAVSTRTVDRRVTIRFDANIGDGLPWVFKPEQARQEVRIGENRMAYYKAINTSDHAITGRAVFNVTPEKAGAYFQKVQCFCFEEQTLKAGQAVDMPVLYYLDPTWVDDPDMADVREVTLSYTFFPSKTAP